MDFENQNILITGAAEGLGLAISKSFANKKVLQEVNICDVQKNKLSVTIFIRIELPKFYYSVIS